MRAPSRPSAAPRPSPARLSAGAILLAALAVLLGVDALDAQTLRGSAASLDRQNEQARLHGFTYLQTPADVRRFVEEGHLVPVRPNADFDLHQVSFPYARPAVRLFIERLASQYRAACGEKLVVTSLTRPISTQPPNASSRSVHPTGMALDLRRPANARCRSWLESTLLAIESNGVIEAIYERNPPHYHVTVYPNPYTQYVQARTGAQDVLVASSGPDPVLELRYRTHRIQRGETLSTIASRYGTTVARLRAENGIRGSQIMAGQSLRIPVYEPAPATRTASAEAAPGNASEARENASAVHAPSPARSLEAPVRAQQAANSAPEQASPARAGSEGLNGDTPDASGEIRHTVGRGESLWTIARLYGVREAELRAANGIRGNRILVGQELRVPGVSLASGAEVIRHEVRPGESLWTIAQEHGTSVAEIRRQNGIGTNRIQAGQVLEVPIGR